MPWTSVNTVATGEIYTASMYNTYTRDNTSYLYDNRLPTTGGTLTGAVLSSGATNLGSTAAQFGTVYANAFTSTGGLTVGAAIASSNAPNIGSTSARFGTAYVAGLNASSNVLGDNITTLDVQRLMDY